MGITHLTLLLFATVYIAWGAVFLDGVERKLGELENTLGSLADKFLCGTTTSDTTAEGLTVTKDPGKR